MHDVRSLIEVAHGLSAAQAVADNPVHFAASVANFLGNPNARTAVALEHFGIRVILQGYSEDRVTIAVSAGAEIEARTWRPGSEIDGR